MDESIVFINICLGTIVLAPIFLLIGIFAKRKAFYYATFAAIIIGLLSFIMVILTAIPS